MTLLAGIVGPLLTPFEDDGRIADDLWVSHAKWLLGEGAHFLSPFGTTGEALSIPAEMRMKALETLVNAGIPADRLMPGTGVNALEDTVRLSAHARDLGCAAIMVLPTFFYKSATEDGHFRYFSALIAEIGGGLPICLYNIPQNSGVWVTPDLTARLNAAFPETVVAYKDSSGDWDNTAAVMKAAPDVAMFPATEVYLKRGLDAGAAGCVSATVNLNCAAMRALYDGVRNGDTVTALEESVKEARLAVQSAGLIEGSKAALAVRSGDRRWLNLRAPHVDTTIAAGEALLDALGSKADHLTFS